MSSDGDHPPARSALKAAQLGLAEGLQRLRMASLSRRIEATLGEGEFSGGGAGALSGSPEGPSLRSQFGMFLPGGLGGGGSSVLRVDDDDLGSLGVRTILGSGSDGSYQVLQGLEARVDTPLSFERPSVARGRSRGSTGEFSTPKESEDDCYRHPLLPLPCAPHAAANMTRWKTMVRTMRRAGGTETTRAF
jgi:hypothetical protein